MGEHLKEGMMTKDAHEDPYQAQHRRFVLPCADCKETRRVHGLRQEPDWSLGPNKPVRPHEPLCAECTEIEKRVWGRYRLQDALAEPPAEDMVMDPDTGHVLYVVLCPRCNGTGIMFGGHCFLCYGNGWAFLDDKAVRRVARWSQTFQQNRVPD